MRSGWKRTKRRSRNPRANQVYPLVVDVQAELFAQLDARVVVPLSPRDRYRAPVLVRAIPIIVFAGREYAMVVPALAAIAKNTLAKPLGSLSTHRFAILTALDLLLAGS